MRHVTRPWDVIAAALVSLTAPLAAQSPDLQTVARNLVQAAMVKAGDKVLVSGSVRDAALLEDIAIETMKAGGQPLIVIGSDQLARRSYDEVPASYDTLPPALGLALVSTFDVEIEVDVGEAEGVLAGVPQARRTARAKANAPVAQAFYRRNVRYVDLGNGLYPTATLSRRLGVPQAELAAAFWRAAGVPAPTLRLKGEALRVVFASARQVTLSQPNGTSLTFGVDASHAIVSDGSLTPEKVAQGGAAAMTWLPAGEFIVPAAPGTAEGTVVIDRTIWDGREVRGLTLKYSGGRLVSMTAASNLDGLKAAYDAAGGAKDQFGFIDIGINSETRLPVGTAHTVWSAPGSVILGLGDNRGFGGANVSDFSLATQLGGVTLKVDGRIVIENGVLR